MRYDGSSPHGVVMQYSLKDVNALLQEAAREGASEIHIKAPNRPRLRQSGVLLPTESPALAPGEIQQIAQILTSMANLEVPLATVSDLEFALGLTGVGRFRVHIYRQRGSLGIVIHRMALEIQDLPRLGVSQDLERVLDHPGLTLIGGGVKRSALMAALVQHFNARFRAYAVVLESPIAFLHRDAMGSIAQRDVGVDVSTFAAGIYAAIKQQADLIAVGDVPDRETAEAVVAAAEHGIAVIATVPSVVMDDVVDHFLKHYSPECRPGMERRVGRLLRAAAYVPDDGASRVELLFEPTATGVTKAGVLPRAAALARLRE